MGSTTPKKGGQTLADVLPTFYRAQQMLENGIAPNKIMATMQREMREAGHIRDVDRVVVITEEVGTTHRLVYDYVRSVEDPDIWVGMNLLQGSPVSLTTMILQLMIEGKLNMEEIQHHVYASDITEGRRFDKLTDPKMLSA
jgi:hypothetical protein